MAGAFIAFEGIDGCGKSTQVGLLSGWARERGIEPLLVREPGGTELGERVRALLLDPSTGDIAPAAEALLYAASRAELVERVIAPALAQGRLVIADRFLDSSLAYQGAGRGLGIERVRAANELAVGAMLPDAIVLLQVPAAMAAQRRGDRCDDRIEASGAGFFERVAAAYDELAAGSAGPAGAVGDASRHVVIDGTMPAEDVHREVLEGVEPLLDQVIAAQVKA